MTRICALILAFTALRPAYCQGTSVVSPPEIPLYALYDSFFYRITWLEELADGFAAQGRDASGPRSLVRREAALTNAEEAIVKKVAKDWRVANEALLAEARAVHATSPSSEREARLLDLQSRRVQGVLAAIGELRKSFTPAAFKLLDVYVRRSSTVGRPAR